MTAHENIFSYNTLRELARADEAREGALITTLYVVEIIVALIFLSLMAYNIIPFFWNWLVGLWIR